MSDNEKKMFDSAIEFILYIPLTRIIIVFVK